MLILTHQTVQAVCREELLLIELMGGVLISLMLHLVETKGTVYSISQISDCIILDETLTLFSQVSISATCARCQGYQHTCCPVIQR